MLIYGLLIIPWPGWERLYGDYFKTMGQMVFGEESGSRTIGFEQYHDNSGQSSLDTAIVIGNRDLCNSRGEGLSIVLVLDARQMGWIPTAFLSALIFATPVSWRRRGWALLGGWVLIHGFILFSLGLFIWNESTRVSLVKLPIFWKTMANQIEAAALAPSGPSFAAVTLIWVLVTFRRQDFPKAVPDREICKS